MTEKEKTTNGVQGPSTAGRGQGKAASCGPMQHWVFIRG